MTKVLDFLACSRTPAQSRHNRRVLVAAICYCLTLVPVVYAVRNGLVAQPWRMILALLPALPVVGFFASYARYLADEKDEYQRTLVVRQILGATTVAMTCAVVWGFLSDLGGAPPIATYWIAFVWVFAQAVMAFVDWRRGA